MIRNRLSELMGARRLNQRDVQRGTGLAYKTVNKWYNDELTAFDRDALLKLCRFLGVSVGDLLVYIPEPEPAADGQGAPNLAEVSVG